MNIAAAAVDNAWALAALLGTTLITGLFGYMMHRAKKSSDEGEAAVEEVVQEVEKTNSLWPVVRALTDQNARIAAKLERYEEIAEVRYPIALDVIAEYQRQCPSSKVHVPKRVRDDL